MSKGRGCVMVVREGYQKVFLPKDVCTQFTTMEQRPEGTYCLPDGHFGETGSTISSSCGTVMTSLSTVIAYLVLMVVQALTRGDSGSSQLHEFRGVGGLGIPLTFVECESEAQRRPCNDRNT
ncbi:uncharacterized [Tachysurus ichikawai]